MQSQKNIIVSINSYPGSTGRTVLSREIRDWAIALPDNQKVKERSQTTKRLKRNRDHEKVLGLKAMYQNNPASIIKAPHYNPNSTALVQRK